MPTITLSNGDEMPSLGLAVYFAQPDVPAADARHAVLTQAWSPIGGVTFYPGWGEDRVNVVDDDPVLVSIAEKHGKSSAQNLSAIDALDQGIRRGPEPADSRRRPRAWRSPRCSAPSFGPPNSSEENVTMQRRPLGRTGVSVSSLCLGTMMFGPWGNNDRTDSVRIIHHALDAGINFVDTADVYGAGVSEEIVGQALKGRRDDVVLATKLFQPMGDDPNHGGGSHGGSSGLSRIHFGASTLITSTSTKSIARTHAWMSRRL